MPHFTPLVMKILSYDEFSWKAKEVTWLKGLDSLAMEHNMDSQHWLPLQYPRELSSSHFAFLIELSLSRAWEAGSLKGPLSPRMDEFLTLIGKTSICSRWLLSHRPTVGQEAENWKLQNAQP